MSTVILAHADCDGMCAAAIAQSRFTDADVFFTKPVSFLVDLKATDADRLIVCDIAITKHDAREILKELEQKGKRTEIYYFDHHNLPDGIDESEVKAKVYVHKANVCTSELIYRHFAKDIPKERIWIALYGAIGDYDDNSPFAMEMIADWDKRALYFEVSTLIMGIKHSRFDNYDAKRSIVKTMATGGNPTDIKGLVEAAREEVGREFELYDFIKKNAEKFREIGVISNMPRFVFRGPAALFAATATESPLGICVFDRKRYIDITARKRRQDIKLDKLMEEAAEHVGGSGGGHAEAAGARIPEGTLKEFLSQVSRLLRQGYGFIPG